MGNECVCLSARPSAQNLDQGTTSTDEAHQIQQMYENDPRLLSPKIALNDIRAQPRPAPMLIPSTEETRVRTQDSWRKTYDMDSFEIKNTKRDGNCLFHALAFHSVLSKREARIIEERNNMKRPPPHRQLRLKVEEWIWSHRQNIHNMSLDDWIAIPGNLPPGFRVPESSWLDSKGKKMETDDAAGKAYVDFMKRNGNWGGQIEIIAAAHVMRRDIVVLVRSTGSASRLEEFFRASTSVDPIHEIIFVLYEGSNHYSGLYKRQLPANSL